MKIVTYNVNGLRARIAPYRSLQAFLNSLDADITCLQETKISRQELTSDIAIAEGYEAFFSCTRSSRKGRIGYSGVATFCRVEKSVSSTSAILPVSADEGFTGLLHCSRMGEIEGGKARVGCYEEVLNMDTITRQELIHLDSEGRCVITDHESFVLFNVYGPCAQPGDTMRMQFKLNFFKALQCRWEGFLRQGRRVIVVGDLNISPFPIDSCDPGPEFDANPCRKWLRSLLNHADHPFSDVFRVIHPERKNAFTCWSQASGAEEFNWGTRIDLILAAGPCLHQIADDIDATEASRSCHGFVNCEVEDCDILIKFKRFKQDSLPRWVGGRSLKLEGSDHAPVFVMLKEQAPIPPHDVPPLAVRFLPELRGRQQSIYSLLQKRAHAVNGNESESKPRTDSPPVFKFLCASKTVESYCKQECLKELTTELKLKEVHGNMFNLNEVVNISVEAPADSVHELSFNASEHCISDGQEEDFASSTSMINLIQSDNRFKGHIFPKPDHSRLPFKNSAHLKRLTSQKFKRKEGQKGSQINLKSFFLSKQMKDIVYADQCATRFSDSSSVSESLHETVTKPDLENMEIATPRRNSELLNMFPSVEVQSSDAGGSVSIDSSGTQKSSENFEESEEFVASMNGQGHADNGNKYFEKAGKRLSLSLQEIHQSEKASLAQVEWKRIHELMARQNPICRGHSEPCAARIVKKAGPNVGRGFYVCARSKGPASNPEARCDHFEWASSKMRKKGTR